MSNRIKSVHEVYFLVRVGQMTEEDLSRWLQDSIDAMSALDEEDGDYSDDWPEEEEDWLADDQC